MKDAANNDIEHLQYRPAQQYGQSGHESPWTCETDATGRREKVSITKVCCRQSPARLRAAHDRIDLRSPRAAPLMSQSVEHRAASVGERCGDYAAQHAEIRVYLAAA